MDNDWILFRNVDEGHASWLTLSTFRFPWKLKESQIHISLPSALRLHPIQMLEVLYIKTLFLWQGPTSNGASLRKSVASNVVHLLLVQGTFPRKVLIIKSFLRKTELDSHHHLIYINKFQFGNNTEFFSVCPQIQYAQKNCGGIQSSYKYPTFDACARF